MFYVSSIICIEEKSKEYLWYISSILSLIKIFLFDIEFLQPYKSRPQTTSLTANRRICAALGLKNPMSSDKTKNERQKIESARRTQISNTFFFFSVNKNFSFLEQKIRDKEEQKTVWDGGVLPPT